MNLGCTHCHDQNWGKRLLGETISQGHGTGFPAYRLEWQGLGSLQRRLRACLLRHPRRDAAAGRAGAHRPRALSRMARTGLPIEAPGVRLARSLENAQPDDAASGRDGDHARASQLPA
jgi:sulfur-oxidizing protein SoxA